MFTGLHIVSPAAISLLPPGFEFKGAWELIISVCTVFKIFCVSAMTCSLRLCPLTTLNPTVLSLMLSFSKICKKVSRDVEGVKSSTECLFLVSIPLRLRVKLVGRFV